MKEPQTSLPLAASGSAERPKWLGWEVVSICALLVLMVFLVFGQTLHHEFVSYDDNVYVYENPAITKGVTMQSVGWAFTHVACHFYHPLTMLSLMLDYEMHGLHPGGYHLTNVLLHAASAVVLFLVLRQMTGALWRCAFVAAVFAVHPLRVESVAWVAERKDVLCGLFFMVTLAAYVRYARLPFSIGNYLALIAAFAVGLLSKPAIVTLPFLLILLDYWPLGRFARSSARSLVLEKLPLVLLAVGACIGTVFAEGEVVKSGVHYSLAVRLGNAVVSYWIYLFQMIFPVRLAPYYQHLGDTMSLWQVILSLIVLAAISTLALLSWQRRPYVTVGWLWYLGMLVPMIGFVQVGTFAHADRFTYLPQIGLCVAGTWVVEDWTRDWRRRREVLGGAAIVVLSVLLVAAYHQTSYWHDGITLWTHTLGCTTNKSVAHNNLGNALLQHGRTEEAIAQYRKALKANPAYTDAHYNLGNALYQQGRAEEAISQYREALRIDPALAEAHSNLGNALLKQGQMEEAFAHIHEALRINPADADGHNNLGIALFEQGRTGEAIAQTQKALDLQPANLSFQNNLAWMLATAPQVSLRNGVRAVQLAMQASQSSGGNNPDILHILAAAYAAAGEFCQAVRTAQHALQLAQTESKTELAGMLRQEIKLYETGQPFRDGE
jgi:tetratricopeptide (TPR) repeat protein